MKLKYSHQTCSCVHPNQPVLQQILQVVAILLYFHFLGSVNIERTSEKGQGKKSIQKETKKNSMWSKVWSNLFY